MLMILLRQILISQDRHEIFLTVASYSAEYVLFLKGIRAAHLDFLTLQEHRPWRIYSRRDMKQFTHIIVYHSGNLHCNLDKDKEMLEPPAKRMPVRSIFICTRLKFMLSTRSGHLVRRSSQAVSPSVLRQLSVADI